MPISSEQEKGFEPLHKGHAIEQVVIAVTMDKEINDDAIKAVKEIIGKPEELPGYSEMAGVSFSFAIGMPTATPLSPSTNGHIFKKVRPDGIIETELKAQRAVLAFRTIMYTRWNDIWAQARTYFEKLLPVYMQSSRIAQISLTYIDKFVWYGTNDQHNISEVLLKGSPYLAPHIFDAADLWHCHTGCFVRADESTKRLINVNTDYLDEPHQGEVRRVISIRTALIDIFNQPGYSTFETMNHEVMERLDQHLQDLHDLDKRVLQSIITSGTARRIALS